MRRKEKEITQKTEIEAVIHNALVCHLGLSDENVPYVVPLCFGYRDHAIYVHCALEGRKIEILKKNPQVCFEFDINTETIKSKNACEWGMKYQSVIGLGKASFLDDPEKKQEALNVIMNHYSGKSFQFPEKALNATAVIKIEITSVTGKQSGFDQ